MKKEEEIKKSKALDVSIKEGSAASVSSSFGDSYIGAFTTEIARQTNPANAGLYVGSLSAISSLVSPIAQFYGSNLMKKYSRKHIVLTFVLLQALVWIPLSVLAILFYFNIYRNTAIYFVIILYSIIAVLGGLAYPAWFSWMGDIVPNNQRGRYFSKRNLITGIVGLVAIIIGAGIIRWFEKLGLTLVGFGLFFALATVFRLISFKTFKKQYSPPFRFKKKDYTPFLQFLKNKDNYKRFAIYQAVFNFTIMIASPFFLVYMKQDLNFSYSMIMIISMSSSVFYLLFSKFAGKFSDKYGNVKLMYISNLCFIASPLLWIVLSDPISLILIPQLVVGLGNAAFVISTTNFTYDAVPQEKRGEYVAYTNILIGIGAFIGSIIGGLLLKYLNIMSFNKFIILFLIAAIARFLAFLIFLPSIKEVKRVSKLHPMHIKLGHPFKALHHEIGHFASISNKKPRRKV